ncbi:hypothetical protein PR001_g9342 [Phytophthora rubi]|uniref:Uncharacterized protein n=1 Tax=Phytophthora rubi TaxID=129364 RepID=A0A6A3N1B3_9STRA|nr:hypothetical protein PR001_g9342 [Phytophthora rubi]
MGHFLFVFGAHGLCVFCKSNHPPDRAATDVCKCCSYRKFQTCFGPDRTHVEA